MSKKPKFLTTQQLTELTSISASWYEKARCRKTGPKYIKIGVGKVLYREDDVLSWLATQEFDPEGPTNG